jgi:hypothetical protein
MVRTKWATAGLFVTRSFAKKKFVAVTLQRCIRHAPPLAQPSGQIEKMFGSAFKFETLHKLVACDRSRREKKLEQRALHRRVQEEMMQRVHVLLAGSRIVDTSSAAAAAMAAVASGGAEGRRLSAHGRLGEHDQADDNEAEQGDPRAELEHALQSVGREGESSADADEDDDYVDPTQPCDAPATPFVLRTVSGRVSGIASGSRMRPAPGSGREVGVSTARSGGLRRGARSPYCEWGQSASTPVVDVATYSFAEQGEEEEETLESGPKHQEQEEEEEEEEEEEAMVVSTQQEYMQEYMSRTRSRGSSSVGSICR